MAVHKDNPTPFYYQIKEDIKAKIKNRTYRVGDKIPSEAELMATYQASRMTVRNAVAGLAHEGFVVKKQGLGTYIKRPRATQQLNQITSWTETMIALGREVSSKITQAVGVKVDEQLEEYGFERGTPLIMIERIRYCDGEPMAIIRNYIIKSIVPDLIDVISDANSLYAFIEKRYGVVYDSATEIVGAREAQADEAKILQVRRGYPVIVNKRIVFDEHEVPFEFDVTVNRADGYEVTFSMKGRP